MRRYMHVRVFASAFSRFLFAHLPCPTPCCLGACRLIAGQQFADAEQLQVQRLTTELLEAQLTRIELKLRQFEHLQRVLLIGREQVGTSDVYIERGSSVAK